MIFNGYVCGMGRNPGEEKLVTHLYKGDNSDPGLPMCRRGWNRANGFAYSIFRGIISEAGICSVCLRRALEDKDGVKPKKRKTKWI